MTILLTLTFLNVSGQDKDLQGKYSREFFMYEYSLTLQDSGKFVVTEVSDLESRTTVGFFMVSDKIIRLTPTKGWTERNPTKEKMAIPLELLRGSSLKIDNDLTLTELFVLKSSDGVETEMLGNKLHKVQGTKGGH
jgi:hypothetical protein